MADKVKRTFRLSQHVTQIGATSSDRHLALNFRFVDYPTFGASLEDLTVPPSEVPAFVSALLSHLDSVGMLGHHASTHA